MKKQTKKLVLSRETMRRLAEADLNEVAGGGTGLGYECNPLTGMPCRFCDPESIGP